MLTGFPSSGSGSSVGRFWFWCSVASLAPLSVQVYGLPLLFNKPTVSHLLTPIASRNLLLLLSLPTRIQYRQAKVRRRKDEQHVGTAARGIIERLSRLPRGVHSTHRPSGRVCRALSTRA